MTVGDKIPEILGIDQDGREIKASDYRGQKIVLLTSSLRHPKIFIKEFGDFLMPFHQHCLSVYILVQR